MFTVLAFYKFASLPDCAQLQLALEQFCRARAIKGTFIIAPEGLNGTVAGTPQAIAELQDWLLKGNVWGGRLVGGELKLAEALTMPFLRLKVRLKPEIVTLRAPQANPAERVGTYVEPRDWNGLIADEGVVLLDTRNDYEVGLGTFAGAIDPNTQNFTQFKDFVAQNLDPKRDRKVAMFCTGGIRCEKASSYLLSQGFEEVFHLKGGILDYLAQVPQDESRFTGECFVFDERVAVGHGLVPGEATLCRACRWPLTPSDRAHPDYLDGVRCPHCAGEADRGQGALERQRQLQLAKARGHAHLGDGAMADAERLKALKLARRQPKARKAS